MQRIDLDIRLDWQPVELTHKHLGAIFLVFEDHVVLPDVIFVGDGHVGRHVTDPVQGDGGQITDLHQLGLPPLPGFIVS